MVKFTVVRKKASYGIRPCGFCAKDFQPLTSRNKHCSWRCRFQDIFSSIKQTETDCLEWPNSRQPTGYGQFTVTPGEVITTHRLAWIVFNGAIPADMSVLHKCDNRPCCNPAHLFLGTDADNVRDMFAKGRQAKDRKLPRGEQHHMTTLTAEQVEGIRESAEGAYRTAKKYGVTANTVYNIRNGVTWSAGSTAKDQTLKRLMQNGS